jgi:hypothetical protein
LATALTAVKNPVAGLTITTLDFILLIFFCSILPKLVSCKEPKVYIIKRNVEIAKKQSIAVQK